jgi:hypothetical protein
MLPLSSSQTGKGPARPQTNQPLITPLYGHRRPPCTVRETYSRQIILVKYPAGVGDAKSPRGASRSLHRRLNAASRAAINCVVADSEVAAHRPEG